MGRILALDYGLKRTGIAVSDPLQIIATGLPTVETLHLMNFLKQYIAKEKVDMVVLGDPKNLDGTASVMTKAVSDFSVLLVKEFPALKIVKWDERFTSKMASDSIRFVSGKKKIRRDKSIVDKVSAVILLQSFMDSIKK